MTDETTTGEFTVGVTLTALLVAAARAIETRHPDGLIRDPYAEWFVRAAKTPVALPTSLADVPEGDLDPVWGRGGRYFGLRTRVFDDFLTTATHRDGVRQVVLLGAGLDTRAQRLDWPTGTVLYELDQPALFAFKQRVLAVAEATTRLNLRLVAADLEGDWGKELMALGFDPTRPTAWVIEGVLPYLAAPVEQRVITTVSGLSAPGSVIAYEVLEDQETDEVRNSAIYDGTERKMGVHLSGLFHTDGRPDSAAALTKSGWEMSGDPVELFTKRYGRGPELGVDDAISHARWVRGHRARMSRTD
jgi:methyltransferase (TIGR00027 family)